MLVLLSPAKRLDFETPLPVAEHSNPQFAAQAHELIEVLRQYSSAELGKLMKLSGELAQLNHERYAAWSRRFTTKNSRPALFAFAGDVYEGLAAHQFSPQDVAWADQHLLILSGLFGALRPLDLIQPYRLEMGTSLANSQGSSLYAFWTGRVGDYLLQRLTEQGSACIVNLASQEYAKVIDRKRLGKAALIDCVFEDFSQGDWRVVGLFAKRARGWMARYIVEQRIEKLSQLKKFKTGGYQYQADLSQPDRLVFRRPVS